MKTRGRGSLKSWVTVGAWGALCWVVAYKQPTYNIQQYLQHTTYNTAVHCGSLTSPSVGSPPINSQATVGPWALCGTTSCTPSWWICATCNTIFKSRVQLHRYIASWLDGTQVKIKLGCKLHSASTWCHLMSDVSCFVYVWLGDLVVGGGTLRAGGGKVQGPMAVVHYCDCSLTSGTGLGLPDNLIIPQFPPPGSLQCNGPPTSHLFSTKLTENLIWLAFLCEPYLISIGLWKESDHNENWQPKIRRHCTAVHWCNRYKYRLSLPSECESIILIQLFNGWTTLLSLRKLWSDPNLTACHMWTCWQTYFWILQVPGCLEPTN